ncbi:MAG: RHS repeat-associated core domain-containing protein [Paludibacteraceae bacterium]|nr:RHS repeat-associated core domain-containing protein [Paludibacteraceae bacterium]
MCRCGFCFKYGEVFIEERNGTWNTPYLFNGKELDEETGLYYYGARYLNPTSGMWLSMDPLFFDLFLQLVVC